MGGVCQGQLLPHIEHTHDVSERHSDVTTHQRANAGAHLQILLSPADENAEIHRIATCNQGRPAPHDVLTVRLLHDARHPLTRKLNKPDPLEGSGCVRDGCLHGRCQCGLEGGQVLALVENGASLVDDPNRDA
ncbi:unannotated protein [freshwater metagenome]|uniref:Unannotated protein n=1 Tax=freshwater metagenome TaxID=449393 RepID=A0A6J7BZK9_9ZZZZ